MNGFTVQLAQMHINELHEQACRARLARCLRAQRRERAQQQRRRSR